MNHTSSTRQHAKTPLRSVGKASSSQNTAPLHLEFEPPVEDEPQVGVPLPITRAKYVLSKNTVSKHHFSLEEYFPYASRIATADTSYAAHTCCSRIVYNRHKRTSPFRRDACILLGTRCQQRRPEVLNENMQHITDAAEANVQIELLCPSSSKKLVLFTSQCAYQEHNGHS
jgi:hypothetical protein